MRTLVVSTLFTLAVAAAPLAQSGERLRSEAFQLAYNLDHAEAEAKLDEALRLAPNEGATHRAIASVTWLNLLFRRGAITVDHYLGGMAKPRIDVQKPPPEIDARFKSHVQRAIEMGRARTKSAPRSADAHYDLGASLGLQASYTASVEGKLMAGFRAAKGAFDAHERVLEIDPSRHDAGLVVGTYRYLVASLSLPVRWMAYIVGFGGGRERGIQMIERAAAYPGESRTEARFALLLIYNRERRFHDALRVIKELQQAFPRNRLLMLEYGGTALRAGRAAEAEEALSKGIASLETDARPRAGAEIAMWHYKRGAARVALGRLDAAEDDLRVATAAGTPQWIQGRSLVEMGKIADLRGSRGAARAQYRQAAGLCETDRDPLCAREARTLFERAFRKPMP